MNDNVQYLDSVHVTKSADGTMVVTYVRREDGHTEWHTLPATRNREIYMLLNYVLSFHKVPSPKEIMGRITRLPDGRREIENPPFHLFDPLSQEVLAHFRSDGLIGVAIRHTSDDLKEYSYEYDETPVLTKSDAISWMVAHLS